MLEESVFMEVVASSGYDMHEELACIPEVQAAQNIRSTEIITVNLHETNQQLAYWDKNIPNSTLYSSSVGFPAR